MTSKMRLPRGETDPDKVYTMPDPDNGLTERFDSVRHDIWTDKDIERSDLLLLLSFADAYIHLTTYELGQECCVSKLRDIWRARRAKAKTETP